MDTDTMANVQNLANEYVITNLREQREMIQALREDLEGLRREMYARNNGGFWPHETRTA